MIWMLLLMAHIVYCHLVNFLWRWVLAAEEDMPAFRSLFFITYLLNSTPYPSSWKAEKKGLGDCSSSVTVSSPCQTSNMNRCMYCHRQCLYVFICKWGTHSRTAWCLHTGPEHEKQTLSLPAILFIASQRVYGLFRNFLQISHPLLAAIAYTETESHRTACSHILFRMLNCTK